MKAFPRYDFRNSRSLNGVWSFAFFEGDEKPEKIFPSEVECDDHIVVPGVFDAAPRYVGRRGTGVYKTIMETTPNARAVVRFGGLGLWARIFVDGEPLETVRLPYSGVQIELPRSSKSKRELAIVVNNVYDETLTPLFHQYYDFYGYSGIYRDVELREIPGTAIDRVVVQTIDENTGTIKATLKLSGTPVDELDFQLRFDDGEFASRVSPVSNMKVEFEIAVPDFKKWSPEKPNLHTITVAIDGDEITERFGIRRISVENGRVAVNGEPVKLLGFCRHEAHPEFGPALPPNIMLEDLQHLKKLGANFIRGVHYPMDQRFLDLCDQLGFLVWEEALGWQNTSEQFQNEEFRKLQLEQTRLMVRNSVNHPSIAMWGFLNESNSEDTTTEMYKELCCLIREEDPTRLVTYASNHPYSDLYWSLVDVVSVNIYPGWYPWDKEKVRPLNEIRETIDKVLAHVEDAGFADKPFILSEIGAGAIYGWRDAMKSHWSEEYQADYLAEVCEAVVEDERISGLALWHLADCRTYNSGRALFRPRAFNNKGIMDEYRRPKLAYPKVAEIFEKARKI